MVSPSLPEESAVQGWFSKRGRWSRIGLAFIAGALMTAGHPPLGLPWSLFLAVPIVVLLVVSAPTPRAAGWIGWAAGFGYFVTGLHWIGHAFVVDAERFGWLMPLGVAALPAGLALFWAAAFWIARRIWWGLVSGALALSVIWSLAEYARANVLTGFPWALPGYVWVDLPPMQAAAWIGPFGVTLVTLVVGSLPGLAPLGAGRMMAGAALAAGIAFWVNGRGDQFQGG